MIEKLRQNPQFESMKHAIGFQREYWNNRAQTGSVKASSSALAQAMVEPFWNEPCNGDVLEVGSGTGVISEQLLRRMKAEDKLTIIEINLNFLEITQRKMAQKFADEDLTGRVSFLHADFLQHQMPAEQFSHICCSLPFNNFEPELINDIFQEMFRVCQPGGIIVFYEYILLRRIRYWLSLGRLHKLKNTEAVLTDWIDKHVVESTPIFSNFPPAMVYVLRKPKS